MDTIEESVMNFARLTKPKEIVYYYGSGREYEAIIRKMLTSNALLPLNQRSYPNCYLHRSAPHDVARTEQVTFICTLSKEDAGPTNNWMDPKEAAVKMDTLFRGSMRGRTMYVVPFSLGPIGSPHSLNGIEITDSPYVVANIHILTRIPPSLDDFDPDKIMMGFHSLGDLDPKKRFIMHSPEARRVSSIGSGYGGNALLGKKCFGLRIASFLGRQEGWLAEHMMVVGVEDPDGKITYIAGAFPSSCGKTNLAMLASRALPGYKIHTVSDDLCWMRPGPDGRLWTINPERGFFAVAPGTGPSTNPNMIEAIRKNTIFTNVGLTPDGEPWWEGLEGPPPAGLRDWQNQPYQSGKPAAHPNARFTAPANQCPTISDKLEALEGVPISAIIFGGRRADTMPLIFESFSWQHGMYLGLTMASETTAAATGAVGVLRRDPFAMLPFTGYHMADSVTHRLRVGSQLKNPPLVFHLNLFRKGQDGEFLWPGFSENIRLLKWIADRTQNIGHGKLTQIGWVPEPEDLDCRNLNLSADRLRQALKIDQNEWKKEAESQKTFLDSLGDRLPAEMWNEYHNLLTRFSSH